MLGREIGRKEGRDREGREGRRDQGGRRRGHSDRFLVGEGWENQLVPRLLRTWTPLPLSDRWVSSFQKGNLNSESNIPKPGKNPPNPCLGSKQGTFGFQGTTNNWTWYTINPITLCWFWALHSALQCVRFWWKTGALIITEIKFHLPFRWNCHSGWIGFYDQNRDDFEKEEKSFLHTWVYVFWCVYPLHMLSWIYHCFESFFCSFDDTSYFSH